MVDFHTTAQICGASRGSTRLALQSRRCSGLLRQSGA